MLPLAAICADAQAWCAPSRSEEPLLADARNLIRATDADWKHVRETVKLGRVAIDSVMVIRDDEVCRRAAAAYWAILRSAVPDRFGSRADTPVLVLRVGSVYLVDDRRSRSGRSAYWEVMVFDRSWRRLYGYGAGAQAARDARRVTA
jgi:hypothetical protein